MLYVPFDGDVSARIAAGKGERKTGVEPAALSFAPGIRGEALKTGAQGHEAEPVYPDAPVELKDGVLRGLKVKNDNFRAVLVK